MGAHEYIGENGWALDKLLQILDDRWKGALILGFVLFNRTIQTLLRRIRKAAGVELEPEQLKPLEPARLYRAPQGTAKNGE
jgi:hypothetical protein